MAQGLNDPARLSAFRLGDIRGIYPDDIDEAFVAAFAHALVGEFDLSGRIAVGHDMRASSDSLHAALTQTLSEIGIEVVDIGLCPTELGYFASSTPGMAAAMIVTASHNPGHYNGLKCVLSGGRAITNDSGLLAIKARIARGYRHPASKKGSVVREDFHARYLEFIKQHFSPALLGDSKVALNGLNGTAASMAGMIADEFQLPVTWFRKDPGLIPIQGADPTTPRVSRQMKGFMAGQGFSLGVAWDGDCDRCVCFDHEGNVIPAYYLIGLLIEKHLRHAPGRAIVFDTKLCWNTLAMIARFNGVPVAAETGHAFMKQAMHQHQAVYGGELSSHHYFGDFFGCDSGMFAWLTVLGLVAQGTGIAALIEAQKAEVVITPEISLALTDIDAAFAAVHAYCDDRAVSVDNFDGPSYSMPGDWRFSLRRSKTEPVVRLNFEAKRHGDHLLEDGAAIFDVLEPYREQERDWRERFVVL